MSDLVGAIEKASDVALLAAAIALLLVAHLGATAALVPLRLRSWVVAPLLGLALAFVNLAAFFVSGCEVVHDGRSGESGDRTP